MDAWAEQLAHVVETNPWMAPLAALLGGLLTAANPCVLAMVPLMIGYAAGQESRSTLRSFLLSLAFAAGLTAMFCLLALTSLTAGALLPQRWWPVIAGIVCLIMGAHLVGLLRFEIPRVAGVQPKQRGYVGALLLGLLFGIVSIPCAGPVLIAVLALVPLHGAVFGTILVIAYSLGHCALILVGGTSMGLVQKMADSRGWNRGVAVMRIGAGVLIALVGVYALFWL